MRRLAMILALVTLAFICVATLSPGDLRPRSGAPAIFERFAAFAVLCALSVFARPDRWRLVVVLVLISGGALEAAQNLIPGRHGLLFDFETKALGSIVGAAAARSLESFGMQRRRPNSLSNLIGGGDG